MLKIKKKLRIWIFRINLKKEIHTFLIRNFFNRQNTRHVVYLLQQEMRTLNDIEKPRSHGNPRD